LKPKSANKSLTISKGQSESVNRRKTYNTMTNNDHIKLHRKLKIKEHEPNKNQR